MIFFVFRSCTLNLVMMFTCAVAAHGQDQHHALQEGAWALQFRVSGLVNLSDFQGGIISTKYHFSDRRSVRLGLLLSASKSERADETIDETETTFPDTDPMSQENLTERDQDGHSYSVGLNSQYVVYPAPLGRLKPFFGAGPRIAISWANNEAVIDAPAPSQSGPHQRRESDYRSAGWTVGADGLVGVEWFPARRISFTTEYVVGIAFSMRSSTREEQTTTTRQTPGGTRVDVNTSIDKTEQSSWNLGSMGVRLGLSLYL